MERGLAGASRKDGWASEDGLCSSGSEGELWGGNEASGRGNGVGGVMTFEGAMLAHFPLLLG